MTKKRKKTVTRFPIKTSGMTKKRKKTVTGFPIKTFGNDKRGRTRPTRRQHT